MLCAVALSATGVIPIECAAYDTVWKYLMPMAAACFLLETDVQRLARDGGPVIAGFAVGAVGMVLGALVAWWLLRDPLGPLGAKLAACLCASYVGGSVNFAAVALALQVPSSVLPGAMAADNLLMAGFLATLMAVPVERAAAVGLAAVAGPGKLPVSGAAEDTAEIGATKAGTPAEPDLHQGSPLQAAGVVSHTVPSTGVPAAGPARAPAASAPELTSEGVSLTLAAAATACAVSQHLATALNAVPLTLLIMAVVATAMVAAAQWLRGKLNPQARGPVFMGAAQLGSSLMLLFFAVIGASAGSLSCLAGCGVLVPFLVIMVAVHWAVLAGVGRGLLKLPLQALLLGSNANIGGSATAAAMAAAKGWRSLVQPAMLAGTMGYATGTAAGLAVARIIGAAA